MGAKGARLRSDRRKHCAPLERGALALNLISIGIGAIAKAVSTPARPLHLDAGFSINGWLVVLLTFVLAHVFADGALIREDMEGTV